MEKQQLKRCPIGIQTFEEIINKDYLYIDKTEYIYRMANGGVQTIDVRHFYIRSEEHTSELQSQR